MKVGSHNVEVTIMFNQTYVTNKTSFRRSALAASATLIATLLVGCGQKIATVAANTDAVRQQNTDLPEVVVNGSRTR